MKKIFFIFLFVFSIAALLYGNDEKVTVSGRGRSYKEAVRDALNNAVEQKYGMNFSSTERSQMFSQETYASANGDSIDIRATDDRLAQDIKTISKGRINGYRILSQRQDPSSGIYNVQLEVAFPGRYIVGNDPDNRRRMAIAPFRLDRRYFSVFGAKINTAEWEKALADALNVYMTQSRKFTMLDRDFDAETNAEIARLNDPNASTKDTIRLGQKMATDYLIVGTITFNDVQPPRKNPYSGKYIMPSQTVFATVNYRVIIAATGQLKWSDSIQIDGASFYNSLGNKSVQDSANYAAVLVGDGIISCILPYEIVACNEDGSIVIGEGGKTFEAGEFLSVYNIGKEVVDTRTGEVIDNIETRVGMVKVARKTAKLTYAVVVEGKIENMKVGSRLRRDEFAYQANTAASQAQQQVPAQPGTVQVNNNGGVVVPF